MIYNPFKPHIAELSTGKFVVRKLTMVGWMCFDNQLVKKDYYWWLGSSRSARMYFEVSDLDSARSLLEISKTSIKPKQVETVKVWTC